MKLNPNFLAIVGFLLIGLIWSGGHVGWLIAMGVFIFLTCIVVPIAEKISDPGTLNRPRRR